MKKPGFLNGDSVHNRVHRDIIESTVCENKEVILCGDLNCNYLVPSDHKPIRDIISLNGFKQIIDQPTGIMQSSKTLIDIFATTHESLIQSTFEVIFVTLLVVNNV